MENDEDTTKKETKDDDCDMKEREENEDGNDNDDEMKIEENDKSKMEVDTNDEDDDEEDNNEDEEEAVDGFYTDPCNDNNSDESKEDAELNKQPQEAPQKEQPQPQAQPQKEADKATKKPFKNMRLVSTLTPEQINAVPASFILRNPYLASEAAETTKQARKSIESSLAIIDKHGYDTFRLAQILLERSSSSSETTPEEATAAAIEALAKNNGTNLKKDFDLNLIDGMDSDCEAEEERKKAERSIADAVVKGNPRRYQTALFELAKKQNTIVNLGTGQGKTLIALLCIKEFASPAYEQGKQTLFLVPSVALAVQHTTTLRANTPYKVAAACHTSTNSENARAELASANIIVSTHGAAKDLLMHYGDMFHLERVNLLVVDECHYATGGHGYRVILRKFYHKLAPEKRPRVLGLTASPLVNVKKSVTDEALHKMLDQLESTLDSTLACFSGLKEEDHELTSDRDSSDDDDDDSDFEDDDEVQIKPRNRRKSSSDSNNNNKSGLVPSRAKECVVQYMNNPPPSPLPDHTDIGLHPSRIKEFNQLIHLYEELGPRVTSIYSATLAREVSRNRYEHETPEEFELVVKHLKDISKFCEEMCELCENGGRSDKLIVLESLLEDIVENQEETKKKKEEEEAGEEVMDVENAIVETAENTKTDKEKKDDEKEAKENKNEDDDDDTVGVVFVDRRITALALYDYFRNRKKGILENTWDKVKRLKRDRRPLGDRALDAARDAEIEELVTDYLRESVEFGFIGDSRSSTGESGILLDYGSKKNLAIMGVDDNDNRENGGNGAFVGMNGNHGCNAIVPFLPCDDSSNSNNNKNKRPHSEIIENDPTIADADAIADACMDDVVVEAIRTEARKQYDYGKCSVYVPRVDEDAGEENDDSDSDGEKEDGSDERDTKRARLQLTNGKEDEEVTEEKKDDSNMMPVDKEKEEKEESVSKKGNGKDDACMKDGADVQVSGKEDISDDAKMVEKKGITDVEMTDKKNNIDTQDQNRLLEEAEVKDGEIEKNNKEEEKNDNENNNDKTKKGPRNMIKCDMIVRHMTQVFKYLDKSYKLSVEDQAKAKVAWLHQMRKIRDVLDGLRRKETNVLIATSVVEEGVDVDACSFVIVLDNLKSTKGYVQMKGRARRKDAQFYVFQNTHPDAKTPSMTLETAQKVERRVRDFIERRDNNIPEETIEAIVPTYDGLSVSSEEKALQEGEYRAAYGCIDLSSAKSLLNRYTLSIPMDATARSSRESMLLLMPIYEGNRLTLPAHLPSDVRTVHLPAMYHHVGRREKQNMLALMACVRLHSLNLLNDRLLPLRRRDMQKKLLNVALANLATAGDPIALKSPPQPGESNEVYIYPLHQAGEIFNQNDAALGGNGRMLALVTLMPLPGGMPILAFKHSELGDIACEIGTMCKAKLNAKEWDECSKFYTCIMNARWRRRTGTQWYKYNAEKASNGVIPPYVLCCLNTDGCLDWDRMKRTTTDYFRTEKERTELLKNLGGEKDMPEARLWSPLYDPNITYVSYGPSGLECSAKFPDDIEDIKTYKDYFDKRRSHPVKPDCKLFSVQRLWTLPRKVRREKQTLMAPFTKKKDFPFKIKEEDPNDKILQDGERAPCDGITACLLPKDACMEVPLADASLFLHCVILPQILYHMDQCLTSEAFVNHCLQHLPTLGSYLRDIPLDEVMEALTARSCSMDTNYDRLEWFGDAVLKLIQTDALLRSRDLREWIAYLHEGDLSGLRSAMGSNERLKDAAKSAGLDRFVLIKQLGRGQWVPISLELYLIEDGNETLSPVENFRPSNKVCADVIESLLGLVFLHFGYDASVKMSNEIGISLPQDDDVSPPESRVAPKPRLIELAKRFLDRGDFKRPELIEEALTHSSCIHEEVPCYQKLEWIGDAVLCLAARAWVYQKYPQLEVSECCVVEATLVCNETLGYLSVTKGLHRFINHRDASLPRRLEDFERSMSTLGRGLWGTDPPKVLPDIVEALLGAAHVDGEYDAGQKAALFVLKPITDTISEQLQNCSTKDEIRQRARELMHPKQVVHEMAGGIFQLRSWREELYALKKCQFPIWKGDGWAKANENGNGAIGVVQCCGINVVAVLEPTSHVAKNRACALSLAIFDKCPDLIERLRDLSLSLRTKNIASDEDEGGVVSNDEDDKDEEQKLPNLDLDLAA